MSLVMTSIMNTVYQPYAALIAPLYHSILELLHLIYENFRSIIYTISAGILVFGALTSIGYYQQSLWCLKWIGLGILSSVGFGFGMHTFVLFLAPHIAAVALASHSCKSLNFPEPPYPNEIICPTGHQVEDEVTFVMILQKVVLESFMWGLGTAIGELPPYLAARLRAQAIGRGAGGDSIGSNQQTAKWELLMIKVIRKVGFIGILLCAAIPNPLFDAAGVASGVAKVPFLSFFGATFIGKAIIKVFIQTSFVIFLFHNSNLEPLIYHIDKRVSFLSFLGDRPVATFLEKQRTNVLRKQLDEPKETSWIGFLFNTLICSIMVLFMMSVIHQLDKQYRERKASKPARRVK